MILYIPASSEFSAKMVGNYIETGKLKPAPYNLTKDLCQGFIDALPNGGHTLNIRYKPWPVEVKIEETK